MVSDAAALLATEPLDLAAGDAPPAAAVAFCPDPALLVPAAQRLGADPRSLAASLAL
jgi:hypothetical protein